MARLTSAACWSKFSMFVLRTLDQCTAVGNGGDVGVGWQVLAVGSVLGDDGWCWSSRQVLGVETVLDVGARTGGVPGIGVEGGAGVGCWCGGWGGVGVGDRYWRWGQ